MTYISELKVFLSRTKFSSRNLVIGIEVILVVLIAVYLANFSWSVLPTPSGSAVSVTNQFAGNNSNSAMDTSMASARPSTALKNMFGRAADTGPEQRFIEENIQETQLNLALKGILVDDNTGKKLALIARGSQTEEVYRPGDQIEGAEILDIESRRVLIRRNGVTESLKLEVETAQVRNASTSSATSLSGSGLRRNNIGANSNNGIRRISENERIVSQGAFRQHMQNLPQLLTQARAVPHIENGQQSGFRVVEIQSGSIFQDLGVEREDIIRSVNGAPIRSVDDALKIYSSMKTAKSFQLDLLRRGRPVTIDFSIQ